MCQEEEKTYKLIECLDKLPNMFRKWKGVRMETIQELKNVTEFLHNLELGINITNVTTSSVGIPVGIAGVISFGLYALAPLTAGASVVAATVVLGTTIAGSVAGTVAGTASLIQLGIHESKEARLKKVLKEDDVKTRELFDLLDETKGIYESVSISLISDSVWRRYNIFYNGMQLANTCYTFPGVVKQFQDGIRSIKMLKNWAKNGEDVVLSALKVKTFSNLSRGAKVSSTFGATATAISVGLDIYTLVESSIAIHKGSKCELANKIEKITTELEKEFLELVEKIERKMK